MASHQQPGRGSLRSIVVNNSNQHRLPDTANPLASTGHPSTQRENPSVVKRDKSPKCDRSDRPDKDRKSRHRDNPDPAASGRNEHRESRKRSSHAQRGHYDRSPSPDAQPRRRLPSSLGVEGYADHPPTDDLDNFGGLSNSHLHEEVYGRSVAVDQPPYGASLPLGAGLAYNSRGELITVKGQPTSPIPSRDPSTEHSRERTRPVANKPVPSQPSVKEAADTSLRTSELNREGTRAAASQRERERERERERGRFERTLEPEQPHSIAGKFGSSYRSRDHPPPAQETPLSLADDNSIPDREFDFDRYDTKHPGFKLATNQLDDEDLRLLERLDKQEAHKADRARVVEELKYTREYCRAVRACEHNVERREKYLFRHHRDYHRLREEGYTHNEAFNVRLNTDHFVYKDDPDLLAQDLLAFQFQQRHGWPAYYPIPGGEGPNDLPSDFERLRREQKERIVFEPRVKEEKPRSLRPGTLDGPSREQPRYKDSDRSSKEQPVKEEPRSDLAYRSGPPLKPVKQEPIPDRHFPDSRLPSNILNSRSASRSEPEHSRREEPPSAPYWQVPNNRAEPRHSYVHEGLYGAQRALHPQPPPPPGLSPYEHTLVRRLFATFPVQMMNIMDTTIPEYTRHAFGRANPR